MRISDWSSDVCSESPIPSVKRSLYHFLRDGAFWCVINLSRGCWVFEPGSRKQRFPGMHVFVLDFPETHLSCATAQFFETRSEAHTSELQSLMRISYAVFCLKKKKNNKE